MRIFAAGDFHGDRTHVLRLVERLRGEQVDAIVLNGDLVEEHDIDGVVGPFASLGVPVLLVPGNHESEATADFLALRYGATNLHKNYTVLNNVAFVGLGGATVGMTSVSEGEIRHELAQLFKRVTAISSARKTILVSHMPPKGVSMEQMGVFVEGSEALQDVVEQHTPHIVICGHVHEAAGLEEMLGTSRVINVGRDGKFLDV